MRMWVSLCEDQHAIRMTMRSRVTEVVVMMMWQAAASWTCVLVEGPGWGGGGAKEEGDRSAEA